MKHLIIITSILLAAAASAQPLPPGQQTTPADERMGAIVAQQALINARLGVQLDDMRAQLQRIQGELTKETKRANDAELKLKELTEPK